jgi:hypothetical protein
MFLMKKLFFISLLLNCALVFARGGPPDPVPEIDGALLPQVLALAAGLALILKKKK